MWGANLLNNWLYKIVVVSAIGVFLVVILLKLSQRCIIILSISSPWDVHYHLLFSLSILYGAGWTWLLDPQLLYRSYGRDEAFIDQKREKENLRKIWKNWEMAEVELLLDFCIAMKCSSLWKRCHVREALFCSHPDGALEIYKWLMHSGVYLPRVTSLMVTWGRIHEWLQGGHVTLDFW